MKKWLWEPTNTCPDKPSCIFMTDAGQKTLIGVVRLCAAHQKQSAAGVSDKELFETAKENCRAKVIG